MKFKEVAFYKVPAFKQLSMRLVALHPNSKVLKVGREFDECIYRFYVEACSPEKIALDVGENLLKDIDQNSSESNSKYTKELINKLDDCIEKSIAKNN